MTPFEPTIQVTERDDVIERRLGQHHVVHRPGWEQPIALDALSRAIVILLGFGPLSHGQIAADLVATFPDEPGLSTHLDAAIRHLAEMGLIAPTNHHS